MALKKTCKTCGETKPVGDFFKNPTGVHGVRGTCKVCRTSNKKNIKRQNIKNKYGITLDDFIAMYEQQDGRCAICDKEVEVYTTRDKVNEAANIDHCHVTGQVRAILCNHCNTGLGKFLDSPELLLKAAAYLTKYQ